MKCLIVLAGLMLSLAASAADPPVWLSPVPPNLSVPAKQIPDTDFFEVPVSKFDTAAYWLQNKAFVSQDAHAAAYFGHAGFACPGSGKPYLVRALYENGGTGAFELAWVGDALVVQHESLGREGTILKSALFVCLFKEPTQIYSAIGGAM
jgi:hypothetical protein